MALTDAQFNSLQTQLSSLSESTVVFSYGMWSLVTGVKGGNDEIKTFRNDIRNVGVVYVNKVLPMTESIVDEICNLINHYFTLLDSNDWSQNELKRMVRDIEKAQEKCDILKQMYNTIATDLKPIEKENASDDMDKLTIQYKQEEEYLKMKTQQLVEIPSKEFGLTEFRKFDVDWAGFLAIGQDNLANPQLENDKAQVLTKKSLIPSVKDFIKGVEIFSVFFTDIKECLAKMKNVKKYSISEPSCQMMLKQSDQISSDSIKFLKTATMICSKLLCLPTDPNDQNYANQWFRNL